MKFAVGWRSLLLVEVLVKCEISSNMDGTKDDVIYYENNSADDNELVGVANYNVSDERDEEFEEFL